MAADRRVRPTTLPPLAECLENMGALTSHNSMNLHSLLQGYLFFNSRINGK
jgi:hypothetical protein